METPGAGLYLWFIAIVVMIPLALWLLKRSPLGSSLGVMPQAAALRVLNSLALAPGQRIITLEVGEGENRRWLVLGITQHSITTLHELPPGSPAPAVPAPPPSESFHQLLSRLRSGDKRNG